MRFFSAAEIKEGFWDTRRGDCSVPCSSNCRKARAWTAVRDHQ